MRVMRGVISPTERMMTVTKLSGERLPFFTSSPPTGRTERSVAGIRTMAKVKGIMLARIQSMKLCAAS